MKLWKVTLRGGSLLERYGLCYVVASDATAAYQQVRAELDERNYGFPGERELLSVELLAEDKLYTDTGCRLFIAKP